MIMWFNWGLSTTICYLNIKIVTHENANRSKPVHPFELHNPMLFLLSMRCTYACLFLLLG
jgi:hypothetical protein